MKANELRIGNYVYYVFTSGNKEDHIFDIGDFEHIAIHEPAKEIYQPIPLTEEWLVKFGFDKVTDFEFSIDDSYLTLKVEDDNWDELCMDVFIMTLDMHKPFYITCIEYVHQLQNLYFALTGTELETK